MPALNYLVFVGCFAGGVTAAAAAWGSKWVQLLDWEESSGRARRSEVWALTGKWLPQLPAGLSDSAQVGTMFGSCWASKD